jgi:hypothetical protein
VREERGECRLADAAFTRKHEDLVPHGGEARGYQGDVGVWALWRGCADGLVWAAGAGVALACLVGFGAWAVFCGVVSMREQG